MIKNNMEELKMEQCNCGHDHGGVNIPIQGPIHGGEECCGTHNHDTQNLINNQLEQLLNEHDELTKRSAEYVQVLENIRTRLSEIRGAADALSMLKNTLQTAVNPDGSKMYPGLSPEDYVSHMVP